MHGSRGRTLLGAALIGALFVAGLAIHGAPGGVLLLVVLAALVAVTAAVRRSDARRARSPVLQGVVVVAIGLVAVLKLVDRL